MTDNKKPSFWQNLTSREQILIFIMLAMAITVGGYYGILRPIHDYQTSGKQRYIAAADDAVMIDKAINMRGATASVRQGKAARTRDKQPVSADELRLVLAQTAKEKGISIARMQNSNNGQVTLWINAVQSPVFYDWIYDVQASYALYITTANLSKNDNSTSLNVQINVAGGL